jgi:hypothetical protein
MGRLGARAARAGLAAALMAGSWLLVHAQPAPELRSVIWSRAREAAGPYRTITDASGLVDVDSNVPGNVNAEDLDAVCRARDEAIRRARTWNAQRLLGLGIDDDPRASQNREMHNRHLGAIATYQGDVARAISHFAAGRDALAPYGSADEYPEIKTAFLVALETLGTAHLRSGEVENCLLDPNADRCLFPVLAGGRHDKAEGARNAAELFKQYLAAAPDDLEVRWLLNLSYMLLGTYPQDVPPQYLLKPELFRSEVRMPRFVDVAMPTALGRRDVAGGTIADDFDDDGLIDVVMTSVDHCTAARYFRNRGDGTFEERTAAGFSDQLGAINAVQTDYDNDGRIDVFFMRGGWEFPIRNSLLRNNGDGTFTDVTKATGLSSGLMATHSAAWTDYDNDGRLDVFVGHEMQPGQLFHNRGDGTFEDVTAKSGIAVNAVTKGVVFGDYDNDGYPDLYLSNVFAENLLFHNNRNGTFSEVGRKLGVEKPVISFPTWFFDYDNDGWLDLFVASYPNSVSEFLKYYLHMPAIAETLTLYRNNRDGTFTDVTASVGLNRVVPAMGANFGDLDNDGYLDMYLGTGTPSFGALMPNIMLKNVGGTRFVDVTEATGTGHLQKGHGISFVDIDNDGDEDVILNVGGAVPGDNYGEALFENRGAGGDNHWIALKLVGVKSNRAAIGAKIRVTLTGAAEGSSLRYREVTSGGSFGANSLMQHIGLGKGTIDSLEIEWPTTRTRQVFRNLPADSFLEIREFADHFTVRHPPRLTLRRDMPHEHDSNGPTR